MRWDNLRPRVRILGLTIICVAASCSLGACRKKAAPEQVAGPSIQQQRETRAAQAPTGVRKHWTYLNRLRQTDDFSRIISRTLLNDRQQLGIVFSSSVTDDQIPGLTRKVLEGLAKEFPKEDATLAAYGASSPPHLVGTARIGGATREITFAPSK